MKTIFSNIIVVLVVLLGIGIFYYVIKAYFMMGVGDGYYYDGWGRRLYDPPWWVRWLWPNMQWPGLKWFVIDTVGFWVSLGVCSGLVALSNSLRERK